jgi:signal transduction histidine kinase
MNDTSSEQQLRAMLAHMQEEHAQAQAALREESRLLEILNQTGQSIASQLDTEKLLQTVTDAATSLTGARFGAFFYNRVNEAGDEYQLYTLSGAPREAFEKFGHPRATAVFGPTFRGDGTVLSDDITQDPRYGTMPPHHGMPPGHLPVRSYLAVAVKSRSGEVFGGLFLGHPGTARFRERDARLVEGVAAQAAIAIDNARLYEAARAQLAMRERGESRLRDSDRRKDEFLATLAHELRNPLAPIRNALHVLRRRTPDPALAPLHDIVDRQLRQMVRLVDDLLEVSRITRGKVALHLEDLDVASILRGAIETSRPLIDAAHHDLVVELPSEPIHVHGDVVRLGQVFSNLLNNAAKYTEDGGRIRLAARKLVEEVEVTVEDDGIGIEPAMLSSVFDIFTQVRDANARAQGGLGIGLTLVRSLVGLHSGRVTAYSEGRGKGSRFTVYLPVATRPLARAPDGNTGQEIPTLARRVIVVDDNRDAADTLSMALRQHGAEVQTTYSALNALQALPPNSNTAVIADLGMPELDGFELARRIRADATHANVKLIALSGWGQLEDRLRAQSAGFDAHFTKPADIDALVAVLV